MPRRNLTDQKFQLCDKKVDDLIKSDSVSQHQCSPAKKVKTNKKSVPHLPIKQNLARYFTPNPKAINNFEQDSTSFIQLKSQQRPETKKKAVRQQTRKINMRKKQ